MTHQNTGRQTDKTEMVTLVDVIQIFHIKFEIYIINYNNVYL